MVKKIINIEAIKTLFSPTFRTVIILHATLYIIVTLVASSLRLNIQGVTVEKIFHFPHIWNTLAWIASWFNLLLGILAIILVSNEFQFRTFRKHLMDGLTRNEILLGKVLVFSSIAIYTMILVFGSGLLFGIIQSPTFDFVNFTQGLPYLPVLFLQSLGYMLMAMLFAFMFRNTALSIVAFILYFFPLEPIFRLMIPDAAIKFLPVKVIANLTPMPDFISISLGDSLPPESRNELFGMGLVSDSLPLMQSSLVVIVYLLLFIGISRLIIEKKNF